MTITRQPISPQHRWAHSTSDSRDAFHDEIVEALNEAAADRRIVAVTEVFQYGNTNASDAAVVLTHDSEARSVRTHALFAAAEALDLAGHHVFIFDERADTFGPVLEVRPSVDRLAGFEIANVLHEECGFCVEAACAAADLARATGSRSAEHIDEMGGREHAAAVVRESAPGAVVR